MKRYHIKLTIEGLLGAFAEKYSHTVNDAQWLDLLLKQTQSTAEDKPIDLFDGEQDEHRADPLPLFPPFMKLLRRTATKAAQRRFFTGARLEPTAGEPGPWSPHVVATRDGKPLTVAALGLEASLEHDGEVENLSRAENLEIAVDDGQIVLRHQTWEALFRADLARIIEMLEETMAKDTDLIARRIDAE